MRSVPPGVRPWVIARLSADVGADGRVRVDGRGLLLAGGNNLGRHGDQSVRARLFCAGVPHESGRMPLDARGDFLKPCRRAPAPARCC